MAETLENPSGSKIKLQGNSIPLLKEFEVFGAQQQNLNLTQFITITKTNMLSLKKFQETQKSAKKKTQCQEIEPETRSGA